MEKGIRPSYFLQKLVGGTELQNTVLQDFRSYFLDFVIATHPNLQPKSDAGLG